MPATFHLVCTAPATRAMRIFYFSLGFVALSTCTYDSGNHFNSLAFVPLHFTCRIGPAKFYCVRPVALTMQERGGDEGESRRSWVKLSQERKQNFRRWNDRADEGRGRSFRDQRTPHRDGSADRSGSNDQEDKQPRNDRMRVFTRGDDGLKQVDEAAVVALLDQRERARRNKDFDMADSIRDELFAKLKVHVDDQRRIWWPDGTKPSNLGEEDLWGTDENNPAELNKAGCAPHPLPRSTMIAARRADLRIQLPPPSIMRPNRRRPTRASQHPLPPRPAPAGGCAGSLSTWRSTSAASSSSSPSATSPAGPNPSRRNPSSFLFHASVVVRACVRTRARARACEGARGDVARPRPPLPAAPGRRPDGPCVEAPMEAVRGRRPGRLPGRDACGRRRGRLGVGPYSGGGRGGDEE